MADSKILFLRRLEPLLPPRGPDAPEAPARMRGPEEGTEGAGPAVPGGSARKGRRPEFGARFSAVDGMVLCIGSAITWPLWGLIGDFALLLPVTLVHFFLFCNVFRIRRGAELLWGAIFLVNFASLAISGSFSWWPVLAVQTVATVVILAVENRHPRYHGIFSRRRDR